MNTYKFPRQFSIILLLAIVVGASTSIVQGASVNEYKFTTKWYSKFSNLRSIAVDNAGNVYVASAANNNIQKFSTNGTILATWGTKGSENGQLNYPEGITIDNNSYVYVCDQGNNRIQKFTNNGEYVTKWGSKGSGDGQLNVARSITADAAGNIYVADMLNNRIQKFTSNGEYLTKWGSEGTADGQFKTEFWIAVDNTGYIYATDGGSSRVQKFTSNGEFVAKWGSNGAGNGQFNGPKSIAVDGNGFVYVVEGLNSRVQKFTPKGEFLTTWGKWGTIVDGQLNSPNAMDVDGYGNVYVADGVGGRIQKFTPSLVTVLKIQVADKAGKPIPGTTIKSITQPNNQTSLLGNTDIEGIAYFPSIKPGDYKIQVDKLEFKTGTQTISIKDGQTQKITISLDSGPILANIRVTVKDKDGNPISGATIESTTNPSGQSTLRGTTGADGSTTFNGVILGSYALQASKSGYITTTTQGTASADKLNEFNITLPNQPSGSGGIPGFPYEATIIGFLITLLFTYKYRANTIT